MTGKTLKDIFEELYDLEKEIQQVGCFTITQNIVSDNYSIKNKYGVTVWVQPVGENIELSTVKLKAKMINRKYKLKMIFKNGS